MKSFLPPQSQAAAPDSALRVLVIEDDLIFQRIIETYLHKSTAFETHVVLACDLDKGLAVLAEQHVDAVLLDLTLPDSEGLETLKSLQDAAPAMPVIVLTGLDDEEVAAEAVRGGAQDFIVKSDLNASTLSRSVRYAIERQKSEAALRASESRFRTVVDDQTELVCRYLGDGTLTFVNRAFCRYFDRDPADLDGGSFFDLTECDSQIFESFSPEHPTRAREQQLHREGHSYWLQWTDRALFDPAGNLAELQSVGRDTTEQKRLEHQLHHSQKMESLGRLAGGVAHDFNNLLTVITACCGLLAGERSAFGLPPHPQVEEIDQAAKRAAALTRQLLAVSRRHASQPVVLDLNRVVAQTDGMLRRLLGENVEMNVELAADLKNIKADRAQIEQIIVNLVVNARDAIPEGGTITLSTANENAVLPSTDQPSVELVVRDTGVGMDPSLQEKVFEPFFSTKEAGKGTGLGLSIVDSMVKQSKGTIELESEVGKGTSFRILFPATSEELPPEAAQPVPVAVAEKPRAATILVVEDEAMVRDVVTSLLKPRGYTVIAVATAEEALAEVTAKADELDAILTDIVLPGRSGLQLAEDVKSRYPHLPMLFMSGYTDTAVTEHPFLSTGQHFLQKPFSPDELIGKLEAVLDAAPGVRPANPAPEGSEGRTDSVNPV